MGSSFRKIGYLFTLFFLAGVLVAGYSLFTLPQALTEKYQVLTLAELERIKPKLQEFNAILGIVLGLGVVANAAMIFGRSSRSAFDSEDYEASLRENASLGTRRRSLAAEQLNELDKEHQKEQESQVAELVQQVVDAKEKTSHALLKAVCTHLEASEGIAYLTKSTEPLVVEAGSTYAFHKPESERLAYEKGEGLVGEAISQGQPVNISNVPEGYLQIRSGLGQATPTALLIVPLAAGSQVVGALELASFKAFSQGDVSLVQAVAAELLPHLAKEAGLKLTESPTADH